MPLPDGSVAEVKLDFEVLRRLGEVARSYGLAGAVQHGASTLPDELFHRFPAVETAEIHLATGFQNILYDSPAFPADLRDEMYAYLAEKHPEDRKANMTDAQFYYTARKRALTGWLPRSRLLPGALAARRRREVAATLAILAALNVLVWVVRPDWGSRVGALLVSILVAPVLHLVVRRS